MREANQQPEAPATIGLELEDLYDAVLSALRNPSPQAAEQLEGALHLLSCISAGSIRLVHGSETRHLWAKHTTLRKTMNHMRANLDVLARLHASGREAIASPDRSAGSGRRA